MEIFAYIMLGMIVGAVIAVVSFVKGAQVSAKTMFKVLTMTPDELAAFKNHLNDDYGGRP